MSKLSIGGFLLIILLPWQSVAGQSPESEAGNGVSIVRTTSAVEIDAVLDEPTWSTATTILLPYEWSPGDNTPSPVETECLIAYDDENLYIAFRAHDPDPSKIRAHLADRDTPFLEDTVGFVLDTFDDRRRGFQFRINALGVQMDATNSDVDGSEDWSWDIIWDSAGRITKDGYIVEVAMPFKQLRFQATDGPQSWGFLAMRDYPRSVRHRVRSVRRNQDLACFICQLETLDGLEEIRPGRNFELDPTVTASRVDQRDELPDGRLRSGSEDYDAGLSVRWGVTPNISLNAALNPDFSQVEADSAQLNVNERFALFFEEKRPFFLEGADFFRTPFDLVFTRTVADPEFGAKLTGKQGKSAFGMFVAEDRINNLIFPGNQGSSSTSIDQNVTSGVGRYRRDVGETSTLGVIWAGREADGYENHVLGFDGSLRFGDSDTLRFQTVGSSTQYGSQTADAFGQPTGSFDGTAFDIEYDHFTRDWGWYASYVDIDEDFRADSGFMPRVDLRQGFAGLERNIWGEEGDWYSRLGFGIGVDANENQAGTIRERGGDLSFSYDGPKQTAIRATLSPNREYFAGVDYDNTRYSLFYSVRPHADIAPSIRVNWGETIDFANAQQADFVRVRPRIELNLGRRFYADLRHTWQEFEADSGRLFDIHLSDVRMLYHVNRRTFVRAILQYRAVDRDAENFTVSVRERERSLFTQMLFSYKVNPQTVVLVGYSDDRRGGEDFGLTQAGRSFFLKLGYAVLW